MFVNSVQWLLSLLSFSWFAYVKQICWGLSILFHLHAGLFVLEFMQQAVRWSLVNLFLSLQSNNSSAVMGDYSMLERFIRELCSDLLLWFSCNVVVLLFERDRVQWSCNNIFQYSGTILSNLEFQELFCANLGKYLF